MNRLLSLQKVSSALVRVSQSSIWKGSIFDPVCSHNWVLHPTIRWKSKGAHVKNVKKFDRSDITAEVLSLVKEDKMNKEFQNILSRFQNSLIQRLSLRMTPQIFFDIMLPELNVKLGQVANIILQNNMHQNITSNNSHNRANVGNHYLLVDLTGRPELFVPARKAVISFLDPCKDGSGENRVQSVNECTFTIQLNTVITQESRQRALLQGQELLHQTIHEMDKIYHAHNKLLHSKEAKEKLSEDDLFAAREYLRSMIKEQHKLAEAMWYPKKLELEGEK
ncbi:unnamed protein product [Schistosoma intercalatum]|nr:unnamed protein product [Schistosoma intercalatum]CAH8597603.1 unnamed protein product [Schistosoma intercalatum]